MSDREWWAFGMGLLIGLAVGAGALGVQAWRERRSGKRAFRAAVLYLASAELHKATSEAVEAMVRAATRAAGKIET
jgi:hypothetical protein